MGHLREVPALTFFSYFVCCFLTSSHSHWLLTLHHLLTMASIFSFDSLTSKTSGSASVWFITEPLAQCLAYGSCFISACWMNRRKISWSSMLPIAFLLDYVDWKCLWLDTYPRVYFGGHISLSRIFLNTMNGKPETIYFEVWKNQSW